MATTSEHYLGEAGRRYVDEKQPDPKASGYALNFEYFRPYIRPEDCVLDFGCGNGGMATHIARVAKEVRGLEVNPHARQVAIDHGLTVYPDLASLPLEPTFDVVVSNHVLEHVREPCATLERLRGAMKPGGLIVLKLPFDSVGERYQREWSRDDINYHLHTWTPRNLANTLFESGFEVERCEVITAAWHPRLLPLRKVGLDRFAFWLLAILKDRRQVFGVAQVPGGTR